MDYLDLALPADLLGRASVRGNERAWPVNDIPELIEAVRRAGLINIGGQLQFRFPSAGTCECYWVEVNTCQSDQPELPWNERVDRSAAKARSQFEELPLRYDFVKEGRSAFGTYFDGVEANGGSIEDAMCFVWYVKTETR
jgi:hypothetical protein